MRGRSDAEWKHIKRRCPIYCDDEWAEGGVWTDELRRLFSGMIFCTLLTFMFVCCVFARDFSDIGKGFRDE